MIGWFHRDEPDGDNVPAATLPGPPPGVPSLSFLTLTNHFYSDAAPLPWGSAGFYPALIAKADVIGFDLYPLQEWCQPNRMADVFYAQRELVKLAGEKPTFQWIEADDWKCRRREQRHARRPSARSRGSRSPAARTASASGRRSGIRR